MTPDTKRRLQASIIQAPDSATAVGALIGEPGVANDGALAKALAWLPIIDPELESMATDKPLKCSVFGKTFGLLAMRGDKLAERIAEHGMYERHLSWFLRHNLHSGDVFFDVGANVGYHTVLAAQVVGPSGRVISFEPHPAMRRLLTRNIAGNGLTNVTVDPRALSSSSGSARLDFDLFDSGATSVALDSSPTDGKTEVTITTLDQACMDHGIVPFITKIDAEGLEADILMGGSQLFTKRRSVIVMEFCPANNHRSRNSFRSALSWLGEIGYNAYFFRGHDAAAFEPIPMNMLIELGEHWIKMGHIGFVDLLFSRRQYAKKA